MIAAAMELESIQSTIDLTISLAPIVEQTINLLKKKNFSVDPIAGPFISKMVSVISSAYKRHGNILHRALLECLSQNSNLEVWEEPQFQVSAMADGVVNEGLNVPSSLLETNLPYEQNGKRALQIDIIVFNKQMKTLRAYEVKRGNGEHDSGKKRQILRDTLCTQVLLSNYGKAQGYDIASVSSHVIGYYGHISVPYPFALRGMDLDEHFGFSIHAEIEKVNTLYRERLHAILNA